MFIFQVPKMGENLLDAHTFSLDFQGNTYSTTTITQSHTTKLIVATINRKVFCMELSMSHCARPCGCVVVPQSQEIQFTYIPSGAEIISIDAFNRSKHEEDFVIGVTIIKSAESGSAGQYLNIYSDSNWDNFSDSRPFQLENLAQNCVSLLLDFIPYQLSHCRVEDTTVWLLGGSDRRLHIYSEDTAKHMYMEVDPGAVLPELARTLPSVPMWTDITLRGPVRVSATGCEDGTLVVTKIRVNDPDSLETFEKQFDGPLVSTRLFSLTPDPLTPPPYLKVKTDIAETQMSPSLNLCVSHSLGETQVFHNILDCGLAQSSLLPGSDLHDIVTSLCVADVEMRGRQSLILGTYGQQILCYDAGEDGSSEWRLAWARSMSAPVLGVRCEDVTGDGVRERVVVTSRGVQVLQPQLDTVKMVTIERLRTLVAKNQGQNNKH